MAFDLGEIKNQVALITGHDGLSTRVATWTNRTLMEIVSRAHFSRQIKRHLREVPAAPEATATAGNISSYYMTEFTQSDVVTLNKVEEVYADWTGVNPQTVAKYRQPVIHLDAEAMVAQHHGSTMISHSSDIASNYAVMGWDSNSASSDYFGPQILLEPHANTGVVTGQTESSVYGQLVHFLQAPGKVAANADANWVLQKYFNTVLSGVLRYARLYLGDVQGYYIEKAELENGIRQILLAEETSIASTPRLRGVYPETLRSRGR